MPAASKARILSGFLYSGEPSETPPRTACVDVRLCAENKQLADLDQQKDLICGFQNFLDRKSDFWIGSKLVESLCEISRQQRDDP